MVRSPSCWAGGMDAPEGVFRRWVRCTRQSGGSVKVVRLVVGQDVGCVCPEVDWSTRRTILSGAGAR